MAAIMVYLTKEDDQNSFVKKHQRDSYYVKCIHSIEM